MTKPEFSHVCFNVRSLDTSLVFYKDLFGLEPTKLVNGQDGKPFVAFLDLGKGAQLELFQKEPHGAIRGHISFTVEDIFAFCKFASKCGSSPSEPFLRPSGNYLSFLKDPDENEIELICPNKEKMSNKSRP
jgi:catechol 2,3-dioxygenase-like lactoylglutathione lyase family enzyme